MSRTLHARCSCGALQITTSAEPLQVSWCHCQDCRRQSGAPAVVWVGFRTDAVRISGTPRRRRSSSHAARSFCAACGTPITYEDDDLAGEIYIHAGLFDEADSLIPDRHACFASKLPWLHTDDSLAKFDGLSRRRDGSAS